MAKRKGKKRGGSKGINLLPLIGAVGGSNRTITRVMEKNYEGAAKTAIAEWTGYQPWDGKYNPMGATGLIGLGMGAVGSKLAAKSGINRYLPKGINL